MLFLLIILNFSRSLYFIYSYKVVPLRTEGQHYSRKTWLPSDTDQGSLNESMRVKRHILLKRSFKPLKINPACFRSSSQNDSVNDTCSPHTALCNPFFCVFGSAGGSESPEYLDYYKPVVCFWIMVGLAYFAAVLSMIGDWFRVISKKTKEEVCADV